MHYFKIFLPQATYTEVIDQMPTLTFLGLTRGGIWICCSGKSLFKVWLVVPLSLKMKKSALNLSSLQYCAGALHSLMILDWLQFVLLLLCIYQNINNSSALLPTWNIHRTFLKMVVC